MQTIHVGPAHYWVCECGETNFAKGIPQSANVVFCPHCEREFKAESE